MQGMALDLARSARGAAAGAAAAAVWAAQQPVDQRVFGVAYDDTELLGKLVTRGRGWQAAGLTMHLMNGAAFGVAYAHLRDRIPLPAVARGPFAASVESVALWPGVAVMERVHPARDEMPALWGTPGAFAQATWRHLLFGAVLGELERRWNR